MLIVGCVFLLRYEWGQTFLWKNVNGTQNVLGDCFVYVPVKCGYSDYSEKDILQEITLLKLTKEEARELILNTQKMDIERLDELVKKNTLSEDERWELEVIEKTKKYYIRVLEVINHME